MSPSRKTKEKMIFLKFYMLSPAVSLFSISLPFTVLMLLNVLPNTWYLTATAN